MSLVTNDDHIGKQWKGIGVRRGKVTHTTKPKPLERPVSRSFMTMHCCGITIGKTRRDDGSKQKREDRKKNINAFREAE
jgi:hypothetical protein